jgi:hypothetical protein
VADSRRHSQDRVSGSHSCVGFERFTESRLVKLVKGDLVALRASRVESRTGSAQAAVQVQKCILVGVAVGTVPAP